MFNPKHFFEGYPDDSFASFKNPHKPSHEVKARNSINDIKQKLERTDITNEMMESYSPIYTGNNMYLYNQDKGCYISTRDDELNALIEQCIGSPANNSQQLTTSIRQELQRRCFAKDFCFNPNSLLINFADSVYNLKENKTLPHAKKHVFNYCLNCSPFQTVKTAFEKSSIGRFLNQICEGDQQKMRLLQEHCGVLLTGLPCKCAFFWIGVHDSGKSTLANLLRHTVGESLTSAVPFDKFDQQFSTSALRTSRINIAGELKRNSTEAQWYFFKQVTGGDTVSVEQKYENAVHVVINSKLLFLGNFLPYIPNDDALYDRINLFEFTYSIPKKQRDTNLLRNLIAEKDIFAR